MIQTRPGVLQHAADDFVTDLEDMTDFNNSGTPMATALSKEDLERQMRQQILDEAVQATSVSNDDGKKQKKKKRKSLVMIGLLLIVVIVVVVGVLVGRKRLYDDDGPDDDASAVIESTSSPTEPPTMAPTLTPEQEDLLQFLQSSSAPNDATLLDRSSPQYKAFQWLAADTGGGLLNYGPGTLTKYALATLYYATNGDSWVRRKGWLEHSTFCEWEMSRQMDHVRLNRVIEAIDASQQQSRRYLTTGARFIVGSVNI